MNIAYAGHLDPKVFLAMQLLDKNLGMEFGHVERVPLTGLLIALAEDSEHVLVGVDRCEHDDAVKTIAALIIEAFVLAPAGLSSVRICELNLKN